MVKIIRDFNNYDNISIDLDNLSYDDFINKYSKLFFRYATKNKECVRFAIRIRKFLQTNHMSPVILANKAGVSSGTVYSYTKGYGHMGQNTVDKLETAMKKWETGEDNALF